VILRPLLSRLGALVRSRRIDRDIDDEIAGHLAEATDEYIRQGLSPEDAHWTARRSFGGITQAKEVHRQVRSFMWLEDLLRDLRFGARMLTKNRWMTLSAVVTLAIGIAANNTVFTIVNALHLRDLPFDKPDRIVAIGIRTNNARTLAGGVSYPDFRDWQEAVETFEGMGAMREATMNVGDERAVPERFIGSYISANAFGLLRQQPMLGRAFLPDDERSGAPAVVILGHSLWRNRYGADRDVLGRTIRVNGVPSVVIGVMPEGFSFPTRSRLWQPLTLLPPGTLASRSARDLSAFGRLASNVTVDQAGGDLRRIGGSLAQQHPETNREVTPIAAPYRERSVGGRGRSTLPVLMGVVFLVLVMACANVANLLLARAAVRSQEISVRMAIGAGRRQIVRQLLIESLLLATLAGIAGWGLSLAALRVISQTLAGLGGGGVGLPYWISFTTDQLVFAFSIGMCLVTVVLFGLVPALQASNLGIASLLVETGRGTAGTVRSRRWTHALVVLQVALTPILLTGGALMMRSLLAQYEMDAGVATDRVMWARLDLPDAKYPGVEDRVRFYQQLDERLAKVPGLVAGMVSHAPFGGGAARNLWRENEVVSREPRRPRVLVVTTGPRYFETFRTRIVRGTELPPWGTQDDVASVLLNQSLAAAVFGAEDPIGRRIRLTSPTGTSPGPEWFTIAGIAPDIRQSGTDEASGRDGVAYVSYGTNPLSRAGIVARSESNPAAVIAALREQVRALDRDLPLFEAMSMDEWLAASDAAVGLRVFGTMFVVFAVFALLLSTVGLYAVTAYGAAQRTRELGVRVALGARAVEICWLVTRSAARQLALGLSIGMLGAIGLGEVLGSMLAGAAAIDPLTFAGIAALLAVVGLVASLVPARHAMRLDPTAVLRYE
jgi:predicted permease